MRNNNNDCIRYLMKEMDPSEEILMERAMMEDEDLLIEVESMRQTLRKLDKLPDRNPSPEVADSIMEKAAEQAEKNRQAQKAVTPVVKYAVAATIALTFTAGGAWMFIDSVDQQQATDRSAAVSSVPSVISSDLANAQMTTAGERRQQSSVFTDDSGVEPWIDRNDILRFEDQFSSQDSNFQSILKSSTQKLRLIEHPTTTGGRVNSIQLTGSGN